MGKIVSYTGHDFSLGWLKHLAAQKDILGLWIERPNGVWTIRAEYQDEQGMEARQEHEGLYGEVLQGSPV